MAIGCLFNPSGTQCRKYFKSNGISNNVESIFKKIVTD